MKRLEDVIAKGAACSAPCVFVTDPNECVERGCYRVRSGEIRVTNFMIRCSGTFLAWPTHYVPEPPQPVVFVPSVSEIDAAELNRLFPPFVWWKPWEWFR